jgi:uncharacterized protein YqeY
MLKDKINDDIKNALKSGDSRRRLVLSLVQSAVKNKELEKRAKFSKIHSTGSGQTHSTSSGQAGIEAEKPEEMHKLSDEEIMDVILSEVKKRKESIEIYEKAGREELAQKERDELNILMEYMPEQMSEDEIRAETKKAIEGTGAKDIKEMGKVLGVLMSRIKGRADGQTVSRIVKEELSGL